MASVTQYLFCTFNKLTYKTEGRRNDLTLKKLRTFRANPNTQTAAGSTEKIKKLLENS
jgi:hypothetical protein